MYCSKCGAPLNGASFCATCGTAANAAPVPTQPVTPTAQPNYGNPPFGTPQYGAPESSINGLAIAGFVVSLICISIVGLILSMVALNQINASNGRQGGKGLAIAGVVIGGIGSLFWTLMILSPDFWYGFNSAYYGY